MLKTTLVIVGIALASWILVMVLFSVLSSKPTNLGLTEGALAKCPSSPNCVCSDVEDDTDKEHHIEPISFRGDAQEAWTRFKEIVRTRPRTKIVTEEESYLHAECTSFLFRFVDDLEARLDVAGKCIQVRSASRAGRSDLGVNRARVEALRQAFGE